MRRATRQYFPPRFAHFVDAGGGDSTQLNQRGRDGPAQAGRVGPMRITVSGEIDLANAAAVEDERREAVSHPPTTVSVDLTDLTYLDSASAGVLISALWL